MEQVVLPKLGGDLRIGDGTLSTVTIGKVYDELVGDVNTAVDLDGTIKGLISRAAAKARNEVGQQADEEINDVDEAMMKTLRSQACLETRRGVDDLALDLCNGPVALQAKDWLEARNERNI